MCVEQRPASKQADGLYLVIAGGVVKMTVYFSTVALPVPPALSTALFEQGCVGAMMWCSVKGWRDWERRRERGEKEEEKNVESVMERWGR